MVIIIYTISICIKLLKYFLNYKETIRMVVLSLIKTKPYKDFIHIVFIHHLILVYKPFVGSISEAIKQIT